MKIKTEGITIFVDIIRSSLYSRQEGLMYKAFCKTKANNATHPSSLGHY